MGISFQYRAARERVESHMLARFALSQAAQRMGPV
jgi:hypothetical protein